MRLIKRIFLPLIAVVFFSGFITRDNDIYFQINKGIDIFGRVYKEVALNYVDQLNPEEFMLAGINGMLTSLDPYTNFIDADGQKDIDIITKGKYGGIGATVGLRNDNVTIVDLIEGFSAQRQGMRIGDVITKINNVRITKDNFESLSEMLKGDPGTTISVTVKRDGASDEITFNLVREEIEVKNVTYYGFVPAGSKNAYIKLSGFSQTAGEEVKKALLDLKSKGEIESLILDLRGNPGGLLDAAIDVCGKFLNKGQLIVSVIGRDSLNTKNYSSNEEPIAGKVRMAVLIDGGSASASEIVSGAMQDHDRAVLVGTNSYGKGLVQTIIPLSYNTSLKITTARYYTPSGRSIQKIDYAEKNRVFEKNSYVTQKKFKTDDGRTVLSAGGIMPDTVVQNESKSYLVQTLLADGMFFRFATHFFNGNTQADTRKLSSEYLLNEFVSYLKSQKFEFVSRSEKLIDLLKTAATEENLDASFIAELKKQENRIDASHSNEIEKYKDDIVHLIREELAARSDGRQGRITESLKFDDQFTTAYNILNNSKSYSKFLR
ncbi:MAG: S41 family peptidase [Bacteroidetes bacterium]|nr:S41 family peptidase [Bacteroidota bacterium]